MTSEHLLSLRKTLEQNMHALDVHSQQCLQKLANAAERPISARDLLHRENFDLFKGNNASNTKHRSNQQRLQRRKVVSSEEIAEARKKRDEKEAAETSRELCAGTLARQKVT